MSLEPLLQDSAKAAAEGRGDEAGAQWWPQFRLSSLPSASDVSSRAPSASANPDEQGGQEEQGVPRAAVPHRVDSGVWKFNPSLHLSAHDALDDTTFGAGKREFHRRQKSMLSDLKRVDQMLAEEAERRAATTAAGTEGGLAAAAAADVAEQRMMNRARLAVSLSNYTNVVLLFVKLYACFLTASLAIIASALDSLLDILAGGILWYTTVSMAHHDPARYPVGKRRMQPVGIVVFAATMATLGLQVLLQGVESLLHGPTTGEPLPTSQLEWVLALLSAVVVAKFLLFLLCRTIGNDIVQAYATDHLLDVLTNLVALGSALLANRLAWWVDPVGAIGIALYTIVNWSLTVLDNASSLIGMSASPEFLNKLTYIVFNHDSRIQSIDTVRAWLLGDQYIVEVDIQLPGEMPLKEAHDIGETLQNKLEALPEVDRAFVHLDFESQHQPEHSGGSIHASRVV